MDIRTYFQRVSASKLASTKSKKLSNDIQEPKEKLSLKKRKRLAVISDSDSDEDPIPSKIKQRHLLTSKSPIKDTKRRSPRNAKQKVGEPATSPKNKFPVVTVTDFFGKTPVGRRRELFTDKNNKKEDSISADAEFDIHDDDDFVQTLKEIDKKNGLNPKQEEQEIELVKDNGVYISMKKAEIKIVLHDVKKGTSAEDIKISPFASPVSKPRSTVKDISKNERKVKEESPQSFNSKKRKQSHPSLEFTANSKKIEKDEMKTPPSEEKRRRSNPNYLNYLNRAGPQALGSKDIPEGKDGCFQGLTFVLTGVLDSMERDDAADLIKKYGGKVTQSVSKNTTYIVAGRDSGPSKLEKAEKLGVKVINEDELLDLITTKSANMKTEKKVNSHEKFENTLKVALPTMSTPPQQPSSSKSRKEKPVSQDVKVEASCSRSLDVVDEAKVSGHLKQIKQTKTSDKSEEDSLLWVDKHKPQRCSQIIGQQGDRSNMKKLIQWLSSWHRNNTGEKKKKPFAGKWGGKGGDGAAFKAALLSGPPGIGKTTTATLVCKELGFSYVELNASDTRSKKSLKEVVQELLTNSSFSVTKSDNQTTSTSKHCLLMDEVDGMAGNEDRGGVQELIQLLKISKIPIICMCNDRNHPKIRSLSNYCFDLRFLKPRVEQLKGAMLSLCFKEKLDISPQAVQEVIIGANQDVRQIIHHLSLWCAKDKTLTADAAQLEAKKAKKDEKLNPFDTLKKVFSAEDHKNMSIHDKTELFFYDYSIAPLFVQENYIHMSPLEAHGNKQKQLNLVSKTADSICEGDVIDRCIRSRNSWNLLPVQAVFASIIPGEYMKGNVSYQVNFPSWLGKHSKRNKLHRYLQELTSHMKLKTGGNKKDLNLDYIPRLCDAITQPLLQNQQNGVAESIDVLHQYDLLRDDLDSITELALWPGKADPFAAVNSRVKAAFTRAYNSSGHLIPYSIASAPLKKRGNSAGSFDTAEDEYFNPSEDENDDEEKDDDDIKKDSMIKIKPAAKEKTKKNEASSSKGKGRGKKTK